MDEPHIKETAHALGLPLAFELSPVVVNQKGETVDGRHRLKAIPKWKKRKIHLNDLDTYRARLILNSQRRTADSNDYDEFAKFLQKEEPFKNEKGEVIDYKVTSGSSVAERISELTNIPLRTVQEQLTIGLRPRENSAASALGQGQVFRVPKGISPEIKRLVKDLREDAEANPDQAHELLEKTRNGLKRIREELNPVVEKGRELANYGKQLHEQTVLRAVGDSLDVSTDQAKKYLDSNSNGNEKSDGPLNVRGVGRLFDLPGLRRVLHYVQLTTVTCKACKTDFEITGEKLNFSATKENIPKIVHALADFQTELDQFN